MAIAATAVSGDGERVPIVGSAAPMVTSATGAKTQVKPRPRSSSPVVKAATRVTPASLLAVRLDREPGRLEVREVGGDVAEVGDVAALLVDADHRRERTSVLRGSLGDGGVHGEDLRLVEDVAGGDRDPGEVQVAHEGGRLLGVGAVVATDDDLPGQLLGGPVGHERTGLLDLTDGGTPRRRGVRVDRLLRLLGDGRLVLDGRCGRRRGPVRGRFVRTHPELGAPAHEQHAGDGGCGQGQGRRTHSGEATGDRGADPKRQAAASWSEA